MNVKKTIASVATILSTALSVPAVAHEYTGFFVGLNAGYGSGGGKLNATYQAATNVAATSPQTDLNTNGFRGGLHFGYDYMMTKVFLLGLEGFGDFSGNKGTATYPSEVNNGYTVSTQAKRQNSFGLALRIGGLINNSFLTYLKVGAETAAWKLNTSTSDPAYAPATAIGSAAANKRLTGFVAGLGFETMLTKHISFGGEWTHTWYGKTNTILIRQTAAGANAWTFNYQPRVNDFRLRVGYKF